MPVTVPNLVQGTLLFLSDSRGLPSLVGLIMQPVQPLLVLVVLRTFVELLQQPGDSPAASASSTSAATAASAAAAIASTQPAAAAPAAVTAVSGGAGGGTAAAATAAAAVPVPGIAEEVKPSRRFAEDYPSDEEAEGSTGSKRTDELTYWCAPELGRLTCSLSLSLAVVTACKLCVSCRRDFVKSTRSPPWRASSEAAKAPCSGFPDLCAPLAVTDYLLVQQCFVLVCLLESGLLRALTLLTTSGNKACP
jgi:hypothetical protein